jgi:hypothetical protein
VTFRLARYAAELRDQCAPVGPVPHCYDWLRQRRVVLRGAGTTAILRDVAYLLACGLLDDRFDDLLLPMLIRLPHVEERSLAGLLRSLDVPGWGLPDGFFSERLENGACIVMLEEARSIDVAVIEAAVRAWPECWFVVGAAEELAIPGFENVDCSQGRSQ